MDFHTYTTMRDWTRRSTPGDRFADNLDQFYKMAMADAVRQRSPQFLAQLVNERDWEKGRRPYYNVFPTIIPMLTRLNLDLDSSLIQLPLPALCIRLPKDKNPLTFDWKGKQVSIRCMLLGDMNDGDGISVLIDIGELMPEIGFPVYSYRNFRRQKGLTVENALGELKRDWSAEMGIAVPDPLINDCVRLCCTLCLLGNDSEMISPDVLADDRGKFEQTGDPKYIDKARRRGKVGWDVGRQVEVMPHYRRPHMALVWTGQGRAVPRVVPRRGSVVHREVVEKVPSGFGGG
jgi:hypothetical protein